MTNEEKLRLFREKRNSITVESRRMDNAQTKLKECGCKKKFSTLEERKICKELLQNPEIAYKKLVIFPAVGEYGFEILKHIRYCNSLRKEYIACIKRGDECLYPNASGFYYNWENPLRDSMKANTGCFPEWRPLLDEWVMEFKAQLKEEFPDYGIVKPLYKNSWTTVHQKFIPKYEHILPEVDVAIAPRFRGIGYDRNFMYWRELISGIRKAGKTVGVVGLQSTSALCEADAFSWYHPNGNTQGCIDLIKNATLFVGTDSGQSHLQTLIKGPKREAIIFNNPNGGQMTGLIDGTKLGSTYWHNWQMLLHIILEKVKAK